MYGARRSECVRRCCSFLERERWPQVSARHRMYSETSPLSRCVVDGPLVPEHTRQWLWQTAASPNTMARRLKERLDSSHLIGVRRRNNATYGPRCRGWPVFPNDHGSDDDTTAARAFSAMANCKRQGNDANKGDLYMIMLHERRPPLGQGALAAWTTRNGAGK